MSHTPQQRAWQEDDDENDEEEEDEVIYDRTIPTERDTTSNAIEAFHAHTRSSKRVVPGQAEPATATMEHAVRVPYALQAAGRRTMYDVLLSLHKVPPAQRAQAPAEAGDAHGDAQGKGTAAHETVDERRGLMHLLPSHRAEGKQKQKKEEDEEEAQRQRALGISDFSDSEAEEGEEGENEEDRRRREKDDDEKKRATKSDSVADEATKDARAAAPHTVSSLLEVMERHEEHQATAKATAKATATTRADEKPRPERSVLDLFHDEEQLHATQQQQQQSRRSTERLSGRRVDELAEEPPMSQHMANATTSGGPTQRAYQGCTQGVLAGTMTAYATQGGNSNSNSNNNNTDARSCNTTTTVPACLGKPDHLVLHSFASRQESGRLSSSGTLLYAGRSCTTTSNSNTTGVMMMMMTLASQGLGGAARGMGASPMVWTPACNNNNGITTNNMSGVMSATTQYESGEKGRSAATREAARRRSWNLLLKDNPTALRVVEYIRKRFALWTPHIAALRAALGRPSRSLSVSPHGTPTRQRSAAGEDSDDALAHCGVDVEAVVLSMDAAYSLVRLIVKLSWVNPFSSSSASSSLSSLLMQPPASPWSLFLPEQVYLATVPQLHEHVYLAAPFSVYRAARSIVASYCVTTDALVAQQTRLQQHLRRSSESEDGPAAPPYNNSSVHADRSTPTRGSQPGSLRATPVKTRQMFSAHKPSASPTRPSAEAHTINTTSPPAANEENAHTRPMAKQMEKKSSSNMSTPLPQRHSVSSEVTPFRAGFYDPLAHPGGLAAQGSNSHNNNTTSVEEDKGSAQHNGEDEAEVQLFSQGTNRVDDPVGEDFPAGPDEAWDVPLETLLQLAEDAEAVSTQQARAHPSPSPLSSPDV